jgi:transposase
LLSGGKNTPGLDLQIRIFHLRIHGNWDGSHDTRIEERLIAENTMRSYKSLSQVERAFRCLKVMFDVLVQPIRHRSKDWAPAHFFLCLLAYYIEWHMPRALAPILFEDEELPEDRKRRDPILQPKPSESVKQKKLTHKTADGLPVHSFDTFMAELATRSRVTERLKSE